MKSKLTILLLVLVIVFSCTYAPKETADTIYTNGKIYTVNESQPWAEAIAVKDETNVLWAYDPEIREVVEVLQVREK